MCISLSLHLTRMFFTGLKNFCPFWLGRRFQKVALFHIISSTCGRSYLSSTKYFISSCFRLLLKVSRIYPQIFKRRSSLPLLLNQCFQLRVSFPATNTLSKATGAPIRVVPEKQIVDQVSTFSFSYCYLAASSRVLPSLASLFQYLTSSFMISSLMRPEPQINLSCERWLSLLSTKLSNRSDTLSVRVFTNLGRVDRVVMYKIFIHIVSSRT